MIRKGFLLVQLLSLLSLNGCLLSTTLMLDKSPPRTKSDPFFTTGLVFEADKPKGRLILNGPQVTIREFLTRDIVYDRELDWYTNTSIALVPGKYIIDFHVKYFGAQIWKYKGFFSVDDEAPTHLILKTPRLVTAKPKVFLR